MRPSASRLLLTLSVCLAWALCAVHPLWKYLSHSKAILALAIGLLAVVMGMLCLDRLNRNQRQISAVWLALLFMLLLAAFAVLYPISLRHTLNGGSDREDALRIELTAVEHHQYPYDQRTFLGNPPTPLPGAMLLAAPFFAAGHIAWQNLLWLALFFFFAIRYFRYRATVLFFFAVFLLFAPGNLSDFTAGGDYLTNFFYVVIACALLYRALDRPLYLAVPAAIFLGLALSSRILYAAILIPLLALALQHTTRRRVATLFSLVLLTTTAITLPIFAPHPIARLLQQVGQNSDKLVYIPAALHPQQTLPLLALLLCCSAFFVRMTPARVLLFFSIAGFVLLAPAVVTLAFHAGSTVYEFSYLSTPILAFALWALSRYEDTGISAATPIFPA